MKIINYGEHYEIYEDDLKTFDQLPTATYKIKFSPMSGFSLVKIDNFQTIEEKIYGNHKAKIAKVLKSYTKFNRSLGLILSGEKGMGKSLFIQLLAEEAIQRGMPVVMVTQPYKGVSDFIDKIDQEVLVLFDEFEKVFNLDNNEGESQDDLLGLFDGTSQKKRLYAITVNKLHKVSEFMVSRTGRFHYHIRFDYPTATEIEIYLKDKLQPQFYPEIKHVIAFSNRVKLNYDSLRAIAFELNEGYSFNSAIGDLNILTTDAQKYDIEIKFTNGKLAQIKNRTLNMFSESVRIDSYMEKGDWISISFNPTKINTESTQMIVNGEDVEFDFDDENTIYTKGMNVQTVCITHHKDAGVNYKLAF